MSDTTRSPSYPGQASPDADTAGIHAVLDELGDYRRLAHNNIPSTVPVLAAFDVGTAAVWANETMTHAIARYRRTARKLCDEDVETLAHEFARALEYEDIFREHCTRRDRVQEMTTRLSLSAARSTEESYMNRTLGRERRAEEWVQRIRMEIISAFDRSHHGSGLRESVISDSAENLAEQWVARLRDDYVSKARREYQRMIRLQQAGRDDDVGPDVLQDPGLEQVPVRVIMGMFPTDQSPTLARLLDLMVQYEVPLVVPAAQTKVK